MQKIKKFNNGNYALELIKLVGHANVKYKRGRVNAIVPIRKEGKNYRYKLKLCVDNKGWVDVYIIEPKIKKVNNENPPHIYTTLSKWNEANQEYDELKLCLFLPGEGEFNKKDKLIETIISWAIKWTEFYELWLLTGIWFGGGKHPEGNTDKEKKDEKSNAKRNDSSDDSQHVNNQ